MNIRPGDQAKQLVAEAFKHYNFFWQLRTHFKAEDLPFWQLTSKAHHCCHAAISSTSLSPRHGVACAFGDHRVCVCGIVLDLYRNSDVRLSI